MNTTTGGGVSAGFQRMLTGQNIFISDYTYDGSSGTHGYESPRLYLFYHVNSSVQHEVSVIYSLCLNLTCLYLTVFANRMF